MSYEKLCSACHKTFPAAETTCPHCGVECPNNNPGGTLPTGALLAEDRYVIGRVLDVDGEGILYDAIEQESGLPVLIKEYLPVTLCSKRDEEGAVVVKAGSEVPYKTTLVDFVDLYRNLMQLSSRAGLARVRALFKGNNTAYAVMEYQKSITLTDWLNRQTELLPFEKCFALLSPVAQGLQAMHAAGLIHRGICPDNIRITPDGRAFLTGYATLALRTLNSELKPCLYEGYSAPEQYSTTEFQGPYTDVYSLAAVLYKMVVGTAPVATAGRVDGCPTLKQIGADVSAQISKAVDHAMWSDTSQRTQSIPEFTEELEGGARGDLGATKVIRPVSGAAASRGSAGGGMNKSLLIGGLIALALVVVLVIWLLIRGMVPKVNSSSAISSSAPSVPTATATATPTATPLATVPNFVGQAYTDLQGNAEYQQKYIFNVTEKSSDNVEKGKVISQSPVSGETVPSDRRIDLVVSKGKEAVTVPNYLGYTRGDVATILTGAGIKAENIKMEEITNDGTMSPGVSVKGDRAVGSTMNPDLDTITVYLAGPLPEATPTPTPIVVTPPPSQSTAPTT